jgi:hypothetical protein
VRIYFDVCCLNRPFDDQSQSRIHLESEAVLAITANGMAGKWSFVGSDAVDVEVENTLDADRHKKVSDLANLIYSEQIAYTPDIINRAKFLNGFGFRKMDALHVSCAEAAKADVLLTTDIQFIKLAKRNSSVLKITVENPAIWLAKQEEENENT